LIIYETENVKFRRENLKVGKGDRRHSLKMRRRKRERKFKERERRKREGFTGESKDGG